MYLEIVTFPGLFQFYLGVPHIRIYFYCSQIYWDCYLYIDNGKLTTRLYDKRDDFNFPIVNFPFMSSNIPSAPAYGVYVSQLIRYARTCSNYQDFMERGSAHYEVVDPGISKNQIGSNT